VSDDGVTIVGTTNLPSTMPTDASQLYSKQRLQTLLEYFIKDGALALDMSDEIVAGTTLVHDGAIVHKPTLDALAAKGQRMSEHLLTELTVFILAVFVGIEVIGKVPTTLHTPLMSATNAIHGIVLVGAILVAARFAPLGPVVGFI
jgi:NAD/NADP transhydrogenase alpha subunit